MEMKAEKREESLGKGKSWKQVLLLAACRKRGCGAPSTTPVASWMNFAASNAIIKSHTFPSFSPSFSSSAFHSRISARKLAAALWEFHHCYLGVDHPATMYLGVNNPRRIHRGISRLNNDGVIDHPLRAGFPEHQQPESAGSLRRHIATSLMRHHELAERNNHAIQPLSPASYGSSLEIAPNPAATPDSSIQLRGRIADPNYGFKTSTELLKVLNRIWTLEEQHASNISLVKALKNELDHSRARVRTLLRDQQANRHEISELMNQISEVDLARKNTDQERIDAALNSIRDELERERKLRKRSESLHRKLARELFEIKVALSTTAKELETERKSRELLEGLCDEFSKGIRQYAKQLHGTKQRSDEDHDTMLLHISESWMDERLQAKHQEVQGNTSIVNKLRDEIQAFLSSCEYMPRVRRRSLESIPEISTPPCTVHKDYAFSTDKAGPSNYEEQEELSLSGKKKDEISELPSTQQETDPQMNKMGSSEIRMLQKSDIYDSSEGTFRKKKAYVTDEGQGSNSKSVDKLMSELLISKGSFPPPEYNKYNASPVRQWMTSTTSSDLGVFKSSSKMAPVRDNTLKAKLQEPKTKGQWSRLKILKGSSS